MCYKYFNRNKVIKFDNLDVENRSISVISLNKFQINEINRLSLNDNIEEILIVNNKIVHKFKYND